MSKPVSFLLLACFLYVQVPFALFHHHDHKPVCELTSSKKQEDSSRQHLHDNNAKPCFLCSAQLIKEFSSKNFRFSFIRGSINTTRIFTAAVPPITQVHFISSRAPPVPA